VKYPIHFCANRSAGKKFIGKTKAFRHKPTSGAAGINLHVIKSVGQEG